MRPVDLILKKRDGGELSPEEIKDLLSRYTRGAVPDYQMAAFAMAVFFRGMTREEILHFTLAMAESGEVLNLSKAAPGIIVDKHSTGGVGDKTTLVLAPLVAAAGVPVIKMSGRGLGHTGGTVDKLEAIPGFGPRLSAERLIDAVTGVGLAVVAQMENLVPADERLYALRDVTGTVDSLPLIASSIMSKKLAAGADAIVLDVKAGGGALLETDSEDRELASLMVDIGVGAGKQVVAVVTDMDQPLGRAVGNSLEVAEAIATLKGGGPSDLEELTLVLGSYMLVLGGAAGDLGAARAKLRGLLASGAGLDKLRQFISNQGGDARVVDDVTLLPTATERLSVRAPREGYVAWIDARGIGAAAMTVGAGRKAQEDPVDYSAGIVLQKKVGDGVSRGEPLAVIHFNRACAREVEGVRHRVQRAFAISGEWTSPPNLVRGVISGLDNLRQG